MKALCESAGVAKREGISTQPSASVRKDLLRAGKGPESSGGYSGALQYQYHEDLYGGERGGSRGPDGAAGAGGDDIIWVLLLPYSLYIKTAK